jgi:hypothetical protein
MTMLASGSRAVYSVNPWRQPSLLDDPDLQRFKQDRQPEPLVEKSRDSATGGPRLELERADPRRRAVHVKGELFLGQLVELALVFEVFRVDLTCRFCGLLGRHQAPFAHYTEIV